MAEEHSTAEAHLIGSLIDSLGHSTEDDVFLSGNTPNSSLPIADFALEDNSVNSNAIPPSAVNASAGLYSYQAIPELRHAAPAFWSAPPNFVPVRCRPPYPFQFPPTADHARWMSSMNSPVRVPAYCSPTEVMHNQMYQAYLSHQQQLRDFSTANIHQNGNTFSTPTSPQCEQWESIYTPFGPVRGPGNFTDTPPPVCTMENAASVGRFVDAGERQDRGHNSFSEFELKKRSASVCSLSHAPLSNVHSSIIDKVASSSSLIATSTSSPTTASSPSLPSKGRSYRDVAKSKTEDKHAAQAATPSKDKEQLVLDVGSLRSSANENSTVSPTIPARKFSAAGRESSSDSMSEFGGSESGVSSAPPRISNKSTALEDIVAGRLDAKLKDDQDEFNTNNGNVLKKNVATTTFSGDFQKIMRRKGSQTKMGAVPGRDPSPVLASASRYAVLGKNSPASSPVKSSTPSETVVTPTHILGSASEENQAQRVKLNNEETSPRFSSKSPTRKAAYINNDLSWPGRIKATNTPNEGESDEDESLLGARRSAADEEDLEEGEDKDEEQAYSRARRHSAKQKIEVGESGIKGRKKGQGVGAASQAPKAALKRGKAKRGESGDLGNKRRRQQQNAVVRWINYILAVIICRLRDAAVWLVELVTDIGNQSWEIIVFFLKRCAAQVSLSTQRAWYATGERLKKLILCIRQKEWSILLWWRSRRKKRAGDGNELGLDENIDLPNTGEEALKRLLSCRGQDAYSILGLRPDCTNDEVKYYYRRQAILVHPDKNACYGSDEAFKILAAAFELIGTPERRHAYDLQNLHRTKAMTDIQDMLAKLKEKIEEIRSTMQCDCGGKHKRFPTERELAYARYCRKCGEKHHAREGDIWAESHWFGFLWYYYACMDGAVYDITEWAGCQKNNLKHMKPDTHLVQYRLITGRNARQFHQQQQHHSGTASPGYGQQQHSNVTQQRQSADGARSSSAATAEDLMNQFWEERLGTGSNNVSSPPSSMYLPPGAVSGTPSSSNFGGLKGFDFSTPTQSKFNPPSCPSGDSRPRKAGRRRKPRV